MRLYRIRAVAWKEALHILRDPRSLGMAIAMPMVLLLLFGYALTLDVDRVPLVIWDQSGTQASRDLLSRFTGSRYFALADYARNYRDLERAIDTGRALAGLVIPRDYAGRIASGRAAPVQLILDGSDANTASIAAGYAEGVVREYTQAVALEQVRRLRGQQLQLPLDVRPRVWFNTDLQSRNFIVPGLIAVIMMIIAALLTSLTVTREWERGTMEQLVSTPVKGPELILGKLVPYFGVGLVDVLLAVAMGEFLFHVPLRGSVWLVIGMSAVFLVGTLSLGVVISVMSKNQLLACQLAMVGTFLPAFLLSGFMFAISNMPRPIQYLTCIIPARYFVSLMKSVYLKGAGLQMVAWEAAWLAAFAVVMVVVATAVFRKRLA